MVYLILVLFLLIGGALAVVTVQNLATPVHLVLFSWQSPELPLGLWIMASFLLGAILLYLVSLLGAWGERRELRLLRKRVAALEAQSAPARSSQATTLPSASGPLSNSGPLLPMPGVNLPPQNGGVSNMPTRDFRQ